MVPSVGLQFGYLSLVVYDGACGVFWRIWHGVTLAACLNAGRQRSAVQQQFQ
jgi:hypothetical protein